MSLLKRFRKFRSSSIRREEESVAWRRRMLQQALLERYRLVPGLTGGKEYLSFECFSQPRFFLCHRQGNLIIERYKDSEDYKNEATFLVLENMWFQGFFAFECLTKPGWFIRRTSSGLSLQRYDGKEEFKENASFKLTRKKCLSCTVSVSNGVRVWVRINNMCFTRGVVTKDGPELHIVTTKGKLVKCKRDKPEFLSLDQIPNPRDLSPGTRVIAQWHDRENPYYLATVAKKEGGKYLITYDDDDVGYCELKNIRAILWTSLSTVQSSFLEKNIERCPAWSSLEDIARLSSGMLVNNEELEKKMIKRKETWKKTRKISISDQHLDLRKKKNEFLPSFLSKTVSCRETNTKNAIHWECLFQSDRSISQNTSLGNEQERHFRTRKNGVFTPPKFNK